MSDTFIFLAPLFLLGVIALTGFVGCQAVFPIDEGTDEPAEPSEPAGPPVFPKPPTNVHSEAGDGVVTLLWDANPDALLFEIDRKESPPGIPPDSYDFLVGVTPAQVAIINGFMAYEDHDVTNGITYHYVIRLVSGEGTSFNSPDTEATPTTPFGPFVADYVLGSVRPGEDGWFGFAVLTGPAPLTVHKLGRFYSPSNDGSHEIAIVEEATLQVLGSASVDVDSEDLDGFKYGNVQPAPVKLDADSQYYVVSHESLGGDDFFTQDTIVTTNAEAEVTNAVESIALVTFTTAGGPGHAYGPVNFQY
jgi:hypothetical protein